jgi:hypothetical protein
MSEQTIPTQQQQSSSFVEDDSVPESSFPTLTEDYDVAKEDDMPQVDAQSTDNEESSDDDENDSEEEPEYEEIDMRKNELYQVLSVFLEDRNGNNLCDTIHDLRGAVQAQTEAITAQTRVLFEIGKLLERKLRRPKNEKS